MLRKFSLLLCLFCCGMLETQAQSAPLLHTPSLAPQGKMLAFSYQGDIWTVPVVGGTARRLTIHESYEGNPTWTAGGDKLLFQGYRYGNPDIFSIEVEGGAVERHTWFSGSDYNPSVAPDGTIWFNSRRIYREVERLPEVFTLQTQGEWTPKRKLDALGEKPVVSPNGRYVAFVRGYCRTAREAYVGSANRDIWLFDQETGNYHQLTDHQGQDIQAEWKDDQTLIVLSARSGRYNLYELGINESGAKVGDLNALTNYTEEGIIDFTVSRNGEMMVFDYQGRLYRMPTASGSKPQLIDIDVTKDSRYDPILHKTYSNDVDEMDVSPNGDYLAMIIRGEIVIKQNDPEEKRTKVPVPHPSRDQDVQWLNDSTLVFSSDRSGNFDLYALTSADPEQPDLFKTLKYELKQITQTEDNETRLSVAPDQQQIAFRRNRADLVLASIEDGELKGQRTAYEGWARVFSLAWSPDSRWIAYSQSDLDFNEEVFIRPADLSKNPVNVSMHPRGDVSPVWSPDGSKLCFRSIRNNSDYDVWFAWLRVEDWEKSQRDWEEGEEEKSEKKKEGKKEDKGKKKKEVDPIEIDLEGIHERLVQVTRLAGNEGNLAVSKDGETLFFTTNGGGRAGRPGKPDLMSVKWNGDDLTRLKDKFSIRGLRLGPKGKKFYYTKSGVPGTLDGKGKKTESQSFSAKLNIDQRQERMQLIREGWSALNEGFYDPNFHGKDFSELLAYYRPRMLKAGTIQDFRLVYNLMLGQLNASHMGLYGPTPKESQRERSGLLGVEWKTESGGLRVMRVLEGGPASRKVSRLNEGDILRKVNGVSLQTTNLYSLLEGTANEQVLLEVEAPDGNRREVVIRPTNSLGQELYEAWTESRRVLTDSLSGGRLGYLHIRGMNWGSFERFERELMAAGYGKSGILIDVRYNGGGWTTDMLMAVLDVRQHAYTIPRGATESLEKNHTAFREHYPYGERLPFASWTKPSIALCNEYSYSNAEIFSHAYQNLDLGTLVGNPTFGAVISTGGHSLLDGSYVRMPFRAWYVKETGKNMEWEPAVPDIVLKNSPDGKAKGIDEQLTKAVETLLEEMGQE